MPARFITCLANTEQNLYFYVNDTVKIVPAEGVEIPCPPVVVTGPKFKPVGLLFGRDHLMIKVAFHPTGSHRLLGINMEQTVNAGIDATQIWGAEVLKILDQLRALAQQSNYDSMSRTVFGFIEERFDATCRPEEPIDSTCIEMLDANNLQPLEEWASKACLSLRQFERNFITRVGIAPKLFIRITRFVHAMKIKNEYPDKSWAEVALECNYTDSSHLLKEFKVFAEFPPSRFYLQQTSGYSDLATG